MQRNNAIDAVKGFAILLVMVGHCIVLNGLAPTDPYIYDMIKSVQMPLFMLVSGVLASYGVKKSGRGSGMKKIPQRAVSYLVPFFSWFVLAYLWTNGKAGTLSLSTFVTELKELLFQTDRGLWFLMTLFVATVCAMAAQAAADKFCKKKSAKAPVFIGISFVFYVLFFVQSRSGNIFLSPSLMLQYFPFYLLGYVANGYVDPAFSQRIRGAKKIAIGGILLSGAFFAAMAIGLDLAKPVDGITALVVQMTASLLGTVFCYGAVYGLNLQYQKKTGKPGFLSFVGIYTLEIYVLHFRFARLLGLSEKGLCFYSPEGIAWILLAFLLMSLLTAVMIFILRRIPVLSLLLFGKKHLPLRKASPQA